MKTELEKTNERAIEVNEKVVAVNENLTTALNETVKSIDELKVSNDAQQGAVNRLAQTVIDYSVARMQALKQKVEQSGPIVRYSDQVDRPEIKQVVSQGTAKVNAKPAISDEAKSGKSDTKFKRDGSHESSGVVGAIGKMGMDVARSISTAAKDFAGNIVDTLGSEILPLYPQLKNAVTTVGSGVMNAAKTGYSAFKRVPNDEGKSDKKTVERNETKSVFERITNNGVQREKTTKVLAIQQAHRDHKLLKKVDDIYDFMKLRALFDVLKFATIGAFFSGVGGLITTIVTVLSGLAVFFKDKLFKLFEGMSSKLSEMISGLKDFGKKAVEGAKELVNDVKKKLGFSGKDEKKFELDKDGKPKLDKNGKPIESRPVENTDGKPSKFNKEVQPEIKTTAKTVAGEAVETAGKAGKGIAGEAVSKGAEIAGNASKSGIAGEIMSVFGTIGTSMSKLAGLMMRGLGVVGWAYTGYEVGEAVADVDSHPESVKRANRYLASSGSMDDPTMMQAGIEPMGERMEEADQQVSKAKEEKEQRKEQRQAASHSSVVNAPVNNIQNNTTHSSTPWPFAPDGVGSGFSLPYGMQRR